MRLKADWQSMLEQVDWPHTVEALVYQIQYPQMQKEAEKSKKIQTDRSSNINYA